ncbi:MAG: hypothetical protein HRT72_13530 [Flavobacteriales bacterium]|nr:hypothetical protein [Flavobacteriales bacterium]
MTPTNSLLCIITLTFSSLLSIAQDRSEIAPYDSLVNFLGGDMKSYIGQELYLKPKPRKLRKTGYPEFYLDFEAKKTKENNIYKCCQVGTMVSRYDSLQGKSFIVIGIASGKGNSLKMREYGLDTEKDYYLKLKRKDNSDEFYVRYHGYEHDWQFVMQGFWNKSTELLVGKDYVLRGFHDVKDFKTKKPIPFVNGESWKCIDFSLDINMLEMVMLFENERGQVIAQQKNPHFTLVWLKSAADAYRNEMGDEFWDTIMASKTMLGMTERMVEISLGKPAQTYTAANGVQWIYDHVVILFKDGKLAGYE